MDEKKVVAETAGRVDSAVDEPNRRDPMKFRNGDISLGEAIRVNGGRVAGMQMDALFDASW